MPQNNHTPAVSMNGSASKPDKTSVSPEVTPKKARRRNFSAAQKLKILSETDGLATGELGAYLRKAGLYHSNLSTWRQQRDEGLLVALTPKKRGRPADPEAKRIAQLEKERDKLLKELETAKLIIDVQKKLAKALGLKLESDEA